MPSFSMATASVAAALLWNGGSSPCPSAVAAAASPVAATAFVRSAAAPVESTVATRADTARTVLSVLSETCRRPRCVRHPVVSARTLLPRTALSTPSSTNVPVSSTALRALPPDSPRAALALVGSSLVGVGFDRILPGAGILASLLAAAFLSNLRLVPSSHALYRLCWSLFLPASLALLLLAFQPPSLPPSSPPPPPPSTTDNSDTQLPPPIEQPVGVSVRTVAVPFAIASLASVLGCLAAFLAVTFLPVPGLSRSDARVAMACLSASLVGGSVNFFATARIIDAPSSLLGSLATADLIVMAVYFAFLAAALQSALFRSFYQPAPPTQQINDRRQQQQQDDIDQQRSASNMKRSSRRIEPTVEPNDSSSILSRAAGIPTNILAGTLVTLLAVLIVLIANRIEHMVRWIPGTACAVIAVIAPLVNSYLTKMSGTTARAAGTTSLWRSMQNVARPIGDILFHWLFAAIGTGANIQQALVEGPASLLFTTVAVSVHLVGSFVGCKAAQQAVPFLRRHMEIEDVLIASNAAIGGPATAAAFCRNMRGRRVRGWTTAATFWGVVGYAVGTTVGVAMFRLGCMLSP